MTDRASTNGMALLLGAAFAVTSAVTACNSAIRAGDLKPATVASQAGLTVNPEGWTIIRNNDGAQICREHRHGGKLDDEGSIAAVITYNPSTGAISGQQHWKHGKRAEPPLPFAPGAPY